MRHRLSVALALVAAFAFPGAALAVGNTSQTNVPYDGSVEAASTPYPGIAAGGAVSELTSGAATHEGRAPDKSVWVLDYVNGLHKVDFWKEYSGAHSNIYVGWNDLQAPPASVQQDQTITSEQVAYIGQEFDQKIWESDVFHFGNYFARCPGEAPGSKRCGDEGKKAGIYIYNIRDEAYWSDYRFYVAGYFWGSLNDFVGENAVFVDSFNWADRLGPTAARPYLYEGTVAHEFQHLIHNDVDPDEDSSIDEGMADLAEQFVYGPVTTDSHIGNYLTYHRDSLTDWDGELYDYGNAVLFQDYLWERAGGGDIDAPLATRVTARYQGDRFADTAAKFTDPGDRFTWNLIHDQANGIAGVASQLGGIAQTKAVHRDFTLANLLDGKVTESQWNYRNLALGGPDSDGYSIDDGIAYYDSNVSGNMPPTRKNVRRRTEVEPWGAYYRTFTGAAPGFALAFTGTAQDGVAAHSAPTQWYSGLGNGVDRSVTRSFTVAAGDTLKFWTWFDIETDWDYGYVQASGDNGQTWTTLSQTAASALQTGATNINSSSAWDGAGGFTGTSSGYKQAEFSLGGLAGTVLVRFRYSTDEAVNGQGWYVDDVSVGATTDTVSATTGWSNAGGWLFSTGLQANDWTADAYVPQTKAQTSSYVVGSIALTTSGNSVTGSRFFDMQYKQELKAYGVIANRPDGVFNGVGRLTIAKSNG